MNRVVGGEQLSGLLRVAILPPGMKRGSVQLRIGQTLGKLVIRTHPIIKCRLVAFSATLRSRILRKGFRLILRLPKVVCGRAVFRNRVGLRPRFRIRGRRAL